MAVVIKALANGQLAAATGDLYTVPPGKSAIVKSIRLVNTDTAALTVDLYFLRASGVERRISPSAMAIPAGFLITDESEITLEAGDKIRGKGSVATKVDYVLSGVERDV